jgi:hypothetical protein
MARKRKTSNPKVVPEVVAGKLALEYAELDNRERSLSEESRRILTELKDVSAAKAEKLRLLTAGMSSDAPVAHDEDKDDKKESVYRLVVAKPSHVFSIAEVIRLLDLNRSTASVYLSELAKEVRISRIAKGQYQALKPSGFTISNLTQSAPVSAGAAMPERILALLESEPATPFMAPEVCKRLGLDDSAVNAIRNALSRLSRDGKIEKVSHGKYKALPGGLKM